MSRKLASGVFTVALLWAATGSAQDKADKAEKANQNRVNPSKLRLVEGHTGLTPSGFVKIAGEIHNDTGQWIRAPRIEVELFDEGGQPLGVKSIVTETRKDLGHATPHDGVRASRTIIPPGEVAVFRYLRDVKKVAGKYAKHKLTLSASPTVHQVSVAIEDFNATKRPDGWYTVSGRIKNTDSKADCRSPTAVLGLYTADGKLFDVQTKTPDSHFKKMLKPGESVEFKLKNIGNPMQGAIANVKAWADCQFITE
jgi:hypothetical protein